MNHTMHGIIFSYGKPTGLGDLIAHRIPGSMALSRRLLMTPILSETFAPPSTATNGRLGFSSAPTTWASSCTASARVCWIIWATAAAGI